MTAYQSDTSIADDILHALATTLPGQRVSVLVHDGRVTLRGSVAEAATRRMIKDVVGDVDGVSAITDLITIQPVAADTLDTPATRRDGKPVASRR